MRNLSRVEGGRAPSPKEQPEHTVPGAEGPAFSKELVLWLGWCVKYRQECSRREQREVCEQADCEVFDGLPGRGRLCCADCRSPQREQREHRQQLQQESETRRPARVPWTRTVAGHGQEVVGAGGMVQKQSPQKGGCLEV